MLPQKPGGNLATQLFRNVAALGRIHSAKMHVFSGQLAKVLLLTSYIMKKMAVTWPVSPIFNIVLHSVKP